jgi:peptidyl-prolyl cis-trans isomerase B (cyclophilin B)
MSKTINARIEFVNGKKINLELYPEAAPASVANFVSLAESGFYDGLCFHRVIPGFMIQGGGFKAGEGTLKEKKSGKSIKGEFSANGVKNPLKHEPGVISMARTTIPDSATSQFFICVEAVSYLDGQYAAFGKTSDPESLSVAVSISKVQTTNIGGYNDVPVKPVEIKGIKIVKS